MLRVLQEIMEQPVLLEPRVLQVHKGYKELPARRELREITAPQEPQALKEYKV